jgi:hypothetical protein
MICPSPPKNNPDGAGEGEDQGAIAGTGESGAAVLIPGVSVANLDT